MDNVAGFVRGVGSQAVDMVTGVVGAAGWGWRTITSEEQRAENWVLWEQMRDHPSESLRALFEGITAPIVAEREAGRPGAAVGRGTTEVASILLGTKGLDKLRALAAANRLDDVGDAGRALTARNAADDAGRYIDLVSPARRQHILDGDGTGGGHRGGLGISGKSEFPTAWSDDRIIHEISNVATDPSSVVRPSRGGRSTVTGTRDGIDILVVLDRQGNIVTGYPTNVPRNP